MTDLEKRAIFVAVSVGLLGYLMAIKSRDADCFVRSGVLIVIVGIYFAMLNISSKLEEAIKVFLCNNMDSGSIKKIAEKEISKINRKQKNEDENLIEKVANEVERSVIEGVRKASSKIKMRVLRVEGWILMSGTMISGFGDLII
jgi:hypothetical protein